MDQALLVCSLRTGCHIAQSSFSSDIWRCTFSSQQTAMAKWSAHPFEAPTYIWSPLYSLSAASDQQSKTKRRVESLEVSSPDLEHVSNHFLSHFIHTKELFSRDSQPFAKNTQRFHKCRLHYIVCGMQCEVLTASFCFLYTAF